MTTTSEGREGRICTEKEWLDWREHFTASDPQQQAVYHWQEDDLTELLGWDDSDWHDPDSISSLVGDLSRRYLPDVNLSVLFREQGEDAQADVDDPSAAFRVEPPSLLFYKLGDMASWSTDTILHEFAHAMTRFLYGDSFQGVENHGPEFVGVLCYLCSQQRGVHVADVHATAVEAGLRVLPYSTVMQR